MSQLCFTVVVSIASGANLGGMMLEDVSTEKESIRRLAPTRPSIPA
jgi:hypothetical protein